MSAVEPLVRQLADRLVSRRWMLCTAESCSGGLIAKTCTDLAGSSAWFERGFVSYSNRAKMELLAVPGELLERHGAVSEAVAGAMAAGALANSAAQLAVAVTGIAGPDGGSEEKPVGTVWFGFGMPGEIITERCQFDGSREQVRARSLHHALQRLLELAG